MGGADQEPADRFWRALLLARSQARWGNFSWMSPKTLLASANDKVSGILDREIVPTRRMRWVAAQRARGRRPDEPISWPAAPQRSFLVLGDPGEMDASQYAVVAPVLRMQETVDFMVLCSDVVYPAGDVNQWADAVYLPYFRLPKEAWDKGYEEAFKEAFVGAALGAWDKPVYALPGNHDWYDGLSGFMFHVCGAEGLPPVAFSSSGLSFRERLARRAWQKSSRPKRRLLMEMRAYVERTLDQTEAQLGGPVHAMPRQPGPYCAVDFCGVRLLLIDTGVDGRIDVEQAMWLEKMLEDDLPKIVLSGKPFLVDNRLHELEIQESETTLREAKTLWELLNGGGVVAVVGGDIHNYQRFVLEGAETVATHTGGIEVEVSLSEAMPKLHIVNGGGGAYLKTTHAIKLQGAVPPLRLDGNADVPEVTAFTAYPGRVDSLRLFVRRSRFAVAIVLFALAIAIIGCAVAEVALWRAFLDRKGAGTGLVALPLIALVIVGLGLVAGDKLQAALKASPEPEADWPRRGRAAVLFLARWGPGLLGVAILLYALRRSGVAVQGDHTFKSAEGQTLLLAWVGVVLAPFAVLGPPVLRAFPPNVRVLRSIAAALGISTVGLLAVLGNRTWFEVIRDGILGLLALVSLYKLSRRWVDGVEHRRVRGNLSTPAGVAALAFWTVVGVAPLAAVCGVPLLLFDRGDAAAYVLLLIANTEVCVLLVVGVGLLLVGPLGAALKRLPKRWWAGLLLLIVLPGLAAVLLADVSIYALVASGAACAALPLVAIGAAMAREAEEAAGSDDELTEILKDQVAASDGALAGRSKPAAHVAAIANVPGLSEIAEAVSPPFFKSFLKVSIGHDSRTITFEAYGVRGDEDPAGTERVDCVVLRLKDNNSSGPAANPQAGTLT
jgi:hypothetical protein